MLGKNAKTQFQAHVPCRTCATVCSAGVRKGLRVFHYSSSERSSLKALTHFAATKNEALREKLAYAVSEWSVPPQTHYIRLQQGVGPSTAPCEPGRDALFLHPTLRQAMDAAGRGERGAYSVPRAGRRRCSRSQAVIAWDLDQPCQLRWEV